MGFLTSSIQVRARYSRCAAHWEPHLLRTKAAILAAAALAPNRRVAVLFGAGLLHDVPLRELSEMFEEVVLADVVHTLGARLTARRFKNVRLCTLDVTGVAAHLHEVGCFDSPPLPRSMPTAFLDEERLDLSVSVNLLSQLAWVPGRYLENRAATAGVSEWRRHLLEAHLEYLCRLNGHSALITDVGWRAESVDGEESRAQVLEREWDVVQGVYLPEPDEAWDWSIAPAPERSREFNYVARVFAYTNWKRSAAGLFERGH
ncbi:MAG: hypothetical protein EBS01_11910 [Verrucomicrobia bacterium]|nr:hypothetical protein [Verrucomicrobiota bacterium]